MLQNNDDLEIRENAVELVEVFRQMEEQDGNAGIYRFTFLGKPYTAKIDVAELQTIAECCYRILDRLRELHRNGVTTEQVQEFIRTSCAAHQVSEEEWLWPTVEIFGAEGLLYDAAIHEAVAMIATVQGIPTDSAAYWAMRKPSLMSMVLSVAHRELEFPDDQYDSYAWVMLRAILALDNGYRRKQD